MIYLLTAIGLSPGGSTAVHIYTETMHRTTQITTNLEVRTMPRLCELYPGICLTTEEKAWKTLSQGKKNLRVQYTYYPRPKKNARKRARTRAHTHTYYKTI